MQLTSFDFKVDPETDGYDHIRIHPRAHTYLGRAMWHGARSPFRHPRYGQFASMEAYWQWLRTGRRHEHLRSLYGKRAYSCGLRHDTVPMHGFRRAIVEGLSCRIEQSASTLMLLRMSTLPFLQYSNDDDGSDYTVIRTWDWYTQSLERRRLHIQRRLGTTPQPFEFPMSQLLIESISGFSVVKPTFA